MSSDVETIQRERGWIKIQEYCGCWVKQGTEHHFGSHHLWLPDPLADTPEGWWEFGQILKWAEDQRLRSPYLPWLFDLVHYGDGHYSSRIWLVGNRYTSPPTAEASGDFRTAIIAALAEAVRHESEATG